MTFTDFQSFADWCEDVEEIDVQKREENQITIKNLHNSNGMIVCELLLSAYDSGFTLGPMSERQLNGCILIYDD